MRLLITLLTLLGLTLPTFAETLRLAPRHEDVILTARGEEIVIEGDHGDIVISGAAGRVMVLGDHHDLHIESAAELILRGHHNDITIGDVGAVTLDGHHDDVVVTSSRPVVTRRGDHNTIVSTQGIFENGQPTTTSTVEETTEVVSSSRRLTLDGFGVNQTVQADGQEIILSGAQNHLKLVGNPTSLTVDGAGNVVELETTLLIRVNGANNTVRYRSGNPAVENNGLNNQIVGP